jgi:23S rRNA (adenine2503-C2)-methyltransferase
MKHLSEVRETLRQLGARPEHEWRILSSWAQGRSLDRRQGRAEHFLPKQVREALPRLHASIQNLARLHSSHPAEDGSERLLVQLADGQSIESVLLPKAGLCVSTQVGCAVGCVFCMTGREGLIRQLGSLEIIAQVLLARSLRAVKRVVFMGMGEPAHNLDAALEAIDFLGKEAGIGHKNLVFSSVGDARIFERLPRAQVKPALALSLHSTQPALRRQLLPKAPDIAIETLVNQAEAYARTSGHPIQYQWTLMAGVNDGPQEVQGIIRLLKGKYAVMNLIPYNTNESFSWQRPDEANIGQMVQSLQSGGVLTKVRQSAGQEIDGGCGQLRVRSLRLDTLNKQPPHPFKGKG